MSLILDALNKANQERGDEQVPDLNAVHGPVTTATKSGAGKNIFIATLFLLLLLIAWLLYANLNQSKPPLKEGFKLTTSAQTQISEPASEQKSAKNTQQPESIENIVVKTTAPAPVQKKIC